MYILKFKKITFFMSKAFQGPSLYKKRKACNEKKRCTIYEDVEYTM